MGRARSLVTPKIPTDDDVARYVKAAGENEFVDAKAPCSWHDNATKAALAKDIAAFCNSEGGGAIVIGKSETIDGKFALTGLTSGECKSFDTTEVAKWINHRFSPSISLTCCPTEYNGKSFIVITVTEFADKPVICTRDCERKSDGKFLLNKGAIYVRTENAESTPLQTPDQLSRLVSRAVVKQQRQLREILDSVLAGHNAPRVPTDEEQFDSLAKTVELDLLARHGSAYANGAWKFVIHPQDYVRRWDSKELIEVMHRCQLRHHRFPQEFLDPKPREWGISGGFRGCWGLTHEGLFYFSRVYLENSRPWVSSNVHGEKTQIEPGKWLDISASIETISDIFAFASRLAEEFDSATQMRYFVQASGLQGRHLLGNQWDISLMNFGFEPSLARQLQSSNTLSAGRLRDGWKESAADCAYKLVTLFPGGLEYVNRESLERRIDKYSKEQI